MAATKASSENHGMASASGSGNGVSSVARSGNEHQHQRRQATSASIKKKTASKQQRRVSRQRRVMLNLSFARTMRASISGNWRRFARARASAQSKRKAAESISVA